MKYHVGFVAILITILGAFGYLAVTFSEKDLFRLHGSNEDVNKFLEEFSQKHTPSMELNFTALYGGSGQFQILHPLLDMRKIHATEPAPSCSGVDVAIVKRDSLDHGQLSTTSGFSTFNENLSSESKSKREALENFLREGAELPKDFLTTAPFVDSSGFSYAYFLSQKGLPPFNQRRWVEEHLSFFKVSELKEVLKKYQINSPEYSAISRLNDPEMEEVVKGEPVVLTKDYLLFKNQSRFGFSPLSYWVFDIQDLRSYLKNGKYDLISYSPDALCLQRIGNACWTYSSGQALSYLYKYSLVVIGIVASVFLILLTVYLKYLFDKNREHKKHKLALQVLSHEFRTPVSAMLVLLEQISRSQAKFDISDQDLITRLSMEVYRLQRIIEVSRTYLQADSNRIQFKYIEILSVNSWISDFVHESNRNVQFEPLANDQSIKADPFWLKFVLSSLVQNAFAHGKEPVCVRLSHVRGKLRITVEDHGECEFNSLSQMTDAFVKSSRSKGMGLGLNITKFIVDEWGSEIHFSKSPTTFTLALNEGEFP